MVVIGLYGRRRRGKVCAAIDLGTNSCRLLVVRPEPGGYRVIDSYSRITRLGQGLDATGRLSDASMERTIAALRVCAGKIRRQGAVRERHVATDACRRADNSREFIERVRDRTGLVLEIVPPCEEVRLTFDACRSLVAPLARRVIMVDIGGGSTEVSWFSSFGGRSFSLDAWISVPCGVLSVSGRLGTGPVSIQRYRDVVADIAARFAPFEARHRLRRYLGDNVQMIGASGTVTTLAGIHLQLPVYRRSMVDGITLETKHLAAVIDRVRALDLDGRSAIPSIDRDRAEFVAAGAAILDAVLATWPMERLTVADRGLREGILHELAGPDSQSDLRQVGQAAR